MADVNFLSVDADSIYKSVLGELEKSVGEPLYGGDERRIFGEALVSALVAAYNTCNDAARQTLLKYARGNILDALGEDANCFRLTGEKAQTVVKFKIAAAIDENVIIPLGNRIADGTRYFATTRSGVIEAGATEIELPCEAVEVGESYNGVPAGKALTLVDLVPFVSETVCLQETTGGNDGEPNTDEGDDRFRERIRLSRVQKSTAGSYNAYRYYAMSADSRIAEVNIVSPDAGVIRIYPILEGGALPDAEAIEKVKAACSASDVRPMGDFVEVLSPNEVFFDVELTYYCTLENEAETIKNVEGDGGAIDQYKELQTTQIGQYINPDALRRLVLCPHGENGQIVLGADRVDIAKPSAPVALQPFEIARIRSITVSHKIIENGQVVE